jgi:hypothetical protein
MRYVALLVLSIFMLAQPASADDGTGVIAIHSGSIVLRPDRAYILLRVDQTQSNLAPIQPVFLRTPTEAEAASYLAAKQAACSRDLPRIDKHQKGAMGNSLPTIAQCEFNYKGPKNVFAVTKSMSFEGKGDFHIYLLEIDSGDYIFYGSSAATLSSSASVLDTCNCLGTVGFHATPGLITDLGTFLFDAVDQKSTIPELTAETGLGKSFGNEVIGAAVRPAERATSAPSLLTTLPRRPAIYYAVGTYVEPGTDNINRLAPIPGVMHYSNGRVVDEATGNILP